MPRKKLEDWRYKKPSEWSDEDTDAYMASDDYKTATEQMNRAADVKNAADTQERNKKKRKKFLAEGE